MILTDKCKQEFEKWYAKEHLEKLDVIHPTLYKFWNYTPLSMQSGVLIEFFESLGYYMGRDSIDINSYWLYIPLQENNRLFENLTLTEAIEKANEIRNNSLNL